MSTYGKKLKKMSAVILALISVSAVCSEASAQQPSQAQHERSPVVVPLGLYSALLVRSARRQSLVGLPAKKHGQPFTRL